MEAEDETFIIKVEIVGVDIQNKEGDSFFFGYCRVPHRLVW
jgi:hypothetical protein